MDRVITQAEQLSTLIKNARKSQFIDQARIAARLAITQGRYSQLESDISRLTVDRLLVILNELGLECVVRERQAMRVMPGPDAQDKDSPSPPAKMDSRPSIADTPLPVGVQPLRPKTIEIVNRLAENTAVVRAMKLEPILKKASLGFHGPVTRFGTPSATTTLPSEDVKPSSAPESDKEDGHG